MGITTPLFPDENPPQGNVAALAFDPVREDRLATLGAERVALVWDLSVGAELLRLPGAEGCLAYDPSGERLATGRGPRVEESYREVERHVGAVRAAVTIRYVREE